MTSVVIEPKEYVVTHTISVVQINVVNVSLGSSALLNITMFGPGGQNVIRSDQIRLEGEDYKKWTGDDNYVIDYVLNYYGFTKSS